MSGHSKWATTHRQKEANDARRGAAFTKIANMITIAVKEGGGIGDPDKNFKLRLVMDKARAVNMPKDNIQRAIDRATGAGAAALEEAVFEGFLHGGAGVLVHTVSDNKVRSQQFVREVLDKNGATMANTGAVSHNFTSMGELKVSSKTARSEDESELELIDAGAEELEPDGEGGWYIWTEKTALGKVKDAVEAKGFVVSEAQLTMKPQLWVPISDAETQGKIEAILEKLENLDDVADVWTNYQPSN